jgi:D-alanyl-D-alanine carboxypeptidase
MNTKKIVIGLIVLSPLVVFVSHLMITRPMDTALFFYPLEAFWTKRELTCSKNSPVWLRDLLEFSVDESKSLANQVAYLSPQGILHHCENGWADGFWGIPVNEKHRFRFASVTKVITADLVLNLIDEGKLSLDTRLVDVLTEIKPTKDQRINDIRIEHLLDHSAGFDRTGPEGDIMFISAKKNWCPHQLDVMSKEFLRFAPGEKQVYSNLGYCLLGAVIEKVTGMTYRDYAEKVERLSQFSIRYIDQDFFPDEVHYDFRFDAIHDDTYVKKYDFKSLSSAAGLSGSAISLVKQLKIILLRGGIDRLTSPRAERCVEKINQECYGFAFNHYQKADDFKLFIHSGYLPGALTTLVIDSRGGILALTNAGLPRDIYATNQVLYKIIDEKLMQEYQIGTN